MNKFEKAVTTSVLSMGVTGGMIGLGAHIEHVQDQDRLACYQELEGDKLTACLSDVQQTSVSEQMIQLGILAGLIGSVAAGVQAYRAFDKES